ncbi:MAG: response regulator transcription factor [Defluviitaleaceae bacterium]|nr:response regulator transcription factor [Defluviitaleaceae bacterium]
MNNLIYVADNDLATSRGVQDFLETQNFDVECFKTGEQLYNAFQYKPCALAILSAGMPEADGFLTGVKVKHQAPTPVIILAPEDAREDHAFSVSLGMDAYLPKPLCMTRLSSYVKALMVKSQHPKAPTSQDTPGGGKVKTKGNVSYQDIAICHDKRVASCGGIDLGLTGMELQVLTVLLENRHRAVSRSELLETIWGNGSPIGIRATDDIVKRLRRKLRNMNSKMVIDTVWGFGFRVK